MTPKAERRRLIFPTYLIHYSGETIEVRGSGETYLIKMRTNFFEVDTGLPPKN